MFVFAPSNWALMLLFWARRCQTDFKKNAGVKAVDVERLHALLVGVTKADRCLTEREETRSGSSNVYLLLTYFRRTRICRGDKLQRPLSGQWPRVHKKSEVGLCLLKIFLAHLEVVRPCSTFSFESQGQYCYSQARAAIGMAAPFADSLCIAMRTRGVVYIISFSYRLSHSPCTCMVLCLNGIIDNMTRSYDAKRISKS